MSNKIIVKTTGAFSLMDSNMFEISRKRPHVVGNSHFVSQQLGKGTLKTLASTFDNADDKTFGEYWKDAGADFDSIEAKEAFVIESFNSALVEPTVEDAPPAEDAEALATFIEKLKEENPDKLAELAGKPKTIGFWTHALKAAGFDKVDKEALRTALLATPKANVTEG